MRNLRTRQLAVAAMLAALYAVLCLALAPIAFGPVQLRVAEALTLLPVFTPIAIPAVTVGCLLANGIGAMLGLVLPIDMLFGTLATLLASVCTYALRNIRLWGTPMLASLPPVIFNALIVGAELTLLAGEWSMPVFGIIALEVGAGEVLACCGLGLLLVKLLERTGLAKRLFYYS